MRTILVIVFPFFVLGKMKITNEFFSALITLVLLLQLAEVIVQLSGLFLLEILIALETREDIGAASTPLKDKIAKGYAIHIDDCEGPGVVRQMRHVERMHQHSRYVSIKTTETLNSTQRVVGGQVKLQNFEKNTNAAHSTRASEFFIQILQNI